jgi:hypothetical protein
VSETPVVNPIRDAIKAWQRGELSAAALMRVLVSHPTWNIPISAQAAEAALRDGQLGAVMTSLDDDGLNRFFIFSDTEAFRVYQQTTGDSREQHLMTTTGTWVFRLPMNGVDFIAIDPYTAHNIAYGREHMPQLTRLAAAVELETLLFQLRTGANPPPESARVVVDYPVYLLAVQTVDGQRTLALAPDGKGRQLAAIFTSDDSFQLLKAQGWEGVDTLTLTGRRLFEYLNGLPLDGLVFNCAGPRPVAFAKAFCEKILTAADS